MHVHAGDGEYTIGGQRVVNDFDDVDKAVIMGQGYGEDYGQQGGYDGGYQDDGFGASNGQYDEDELRQGYGGM